MDTHQSEFSSKEIIERLKTLESRITRLEAALHMEYAQKSEEVPELKLSKPKQDTSDESLIESKIGEFGLAWLGNIVLFFCIIFLAQLIQRQGHQTGAAVFGYVSVAGVFVLAHFLKSTFPRKRYIFNLNAWLLLFYVTLKLHFFTSEPLVTSQPIALLLLSVAALLPLFFAVKNRFTLLAGFALVFLSILAVVSDTPHFMLSTAVAIAVIAYVLFIRFAWVRLLFLSIILVYLITIIWFLNNPLVGNQIQAVTSHHFGFVYLFVIAAIYSLVALAKGSETYSKSTIVGVVILNGAGFSMLLSLIVVTFFKDDYFLITGSVSAFCLLYSVLLQLKSEWKITASLYALYGFVMMSIAFHGIYEFPRTYFFLAFQSLLVVSMAIWFQSRFIVIMNTLLFLTLLIFYLISSPSGNGINISFTLVALLTARILNWKRDRLTIKTDLLRNTYLITGFVMSLFTLYHLVHAHYVTLSWTAVAAIFFVLSLILKNVKYRYLALASMLAAAFYLFIIDLARIELIYRIMALMFLAVISIGLSVFYTRRSKKKQELEKE